MPAALMLEMEPPVYDWLQTEAARRGLDRHELIRRALRVYMDDTSLFSAPIPLPDPARRVARAYVELSAADRQRLSMVIIAHAPQHGAWPTSATVLSRAVRHVYDRAQASAAAQKDSPPQPRLPRNTRFKLRGPGR